MENKLHPERFEELGPEFDAVEHLARAAHYLGQSTTETGARARGYIEQARRALHPVTLDIEAHKELADKREYRARNPQAVQAAGVDPRDAEMAQMRAQFAELAKRVAEYEAAPTTRVEGTLHIDGKTEPTK